MPRTTAPADLLVVGGGIMGAALAQQVRTAVPRARIVMIDAGPPIGTVPGQHLHDSAEQDVRDAYLDRVQTGIQSLYLGAATSPSMGGDVRGVRPGMYNVSAFGSDAGAMTDAALGWNAGGMGVHWTAATPWPWGSETFAGPDAAQWDVDLETARALLHVHPRPFGTNVVGERLLGILERVHGHVSAPGRHPQHMPMAVAPGERGPLARTGPNTVLPRMLAPNGEDFERLTGTIVTEILHDTARASGVRVREVATGEEWDVPARAVAVAADTFRTPQLLFASGIRPPALGRYLNEHAFLTGQVTAELRRFGVGLSEVPLPLEGEWALGSYWLPHSGERQPFHGQIMDRVFVDESGERLAYSVGVSLYVPNEVRAENRLEFAEDRLDAAGMPSISVHFSYSTGDLQLIEQSRTTQVEMASALGEFDPVRDSALLAPGSSLHWTGTTRSGPSDDGTSVCDASGRVWGFENLHLAGGAVVPTAVVGNSTLTGVVTAVRAARAVAHLLESVPV
ncbi:GMC oxidoreductase [Kineococcus sp. SYSU DK003]|uniref:GMC oxidoreductase n=1 Tax=Kineococcus sp. SYSU DK003 TaxID=3383124 RepID=UPI003D7E3BFD